MFLGFYFEKMKMMPEIAIIKGKYFYVHVQTTAFQSAVMLLKHSIAW